MSATEERSSAPPWVAYVDMDAYYVSCEIRERPELQGRPVIVGLAPTSDESRGVVLSASYPAREFGVRSAMPVVQAARRCPTAVWIAPDFGKYERTSYQIRAVLERWSDRVVPLSIDEAAVALGPQDTAGVEAWARDVQAALREELQLPSSIGASPFAVVAKIACDSAKPGGIRVVAAAETAPFLRDLPVGAVPGIGPKSSARLAEIGIRTIGELADAPVGSVRRVLGHYGRAVRELARGRPSAELADLPDLGAPRQRSLDRTFEVDSRDPVEIDAVVRSMAGALARSLEEEQLQYRTVVVRLRWADFRQAQRGHRLNAHTEGRAPLEREAVRLVHDLLERERAGGDRAVRRVSLAASNLRPRRGATAPLEAFGPDEFG